MGLTENTSGLTGAYEFLQLGDTKIQVLAFSDKQHDLMHNWVRGEFIRRVEAFEPSNRVLQLSIAHAVTLTYLQDEGQDLFLSAEGLAFCLHLMTAKTEQPLTAVESYELIKNNLKEKPGQKIYDKWKELNLEPLKN